MVKGGSEVWDLEWRRDRLHSAKCDEVMRLLGLIHRAVWWPSNCEGAPDP